MIDGGSFSLFGRARAHAIMHVWLCSSARRVTHDSWLRPLHVGGVRAVEAHATVTAVTLTACYTGTLTVADIRRTSTCLLYGGQIGSGAEGVLSLGRDRAYTRTVFRGSRLAGAGSSPEHLFVSLYTLVRWNLLRSTQLESKSTRIRRSARMVALGHKYPTKENRQ